MGALKLASGCDRRCSFCAIPAFRGSYLSRPPAEVLTEARWLAENGVKEVLLVSENSSSYGKDLGDLRLLENLLPELAAWSVKAGFDPEVAAARSPTAAAVLAVAASIGAPEAGAARTALPVYVRDKIALNVTEQRAGAAARALAK